MKPILFGSMFVTWGAVAVWAAVTHRRRTALLTLAAVMLLGVAANTAAGINDPGSYVDLYGERAWFPYYQDVLHALSIAQLRIIVLAVAACQLTVAVLLITSRYAWLGLCIAIVFLVGVAGLGPENVVNALFALAAGLLLREELSGRRGHTLATQDSGLISSRV